jgi:hypothetical protein
MTRPRYRAVAAAVAASLIFSSTGAIAAAAPAPTPTYQADPWAVLSVMSGGASAVAVCGAAAAAAAAATTAQPAAGCVLPQLDVAPPVASNPPPQPIPVPPVEGPAAGLGISPLLLALGAIAAGVGLYLVLHKNHGNSPA